MEELDAHNVPPLASSHLPNPDTCSNKPQTTVELLSHLFAWGKKLYYTQTPCTQAYVGIFYTTLNEPSMNKQTDHEIVAGSNGMPMISLL